MKKPNFLLSLALGTGLTFAMIGCSSDFVDESVVVELPPQPARMTLNYALSTGDIPLPNDLLFGGSTDLTLNIPTLDDANFADPSASLSTLDGWSAVAPFAINFSSSDANLALDGSSIVAGSTIRVFKVNVFRPDINFGLVDEKHYQTQA
jgi:hypothetical protein